MARIQKQPRTGSRRPTMAQMSAAASIIQRGVRSQLRTYQGYNAMTQSRYAFRHRNSIRRRARRAVVRRK